MHWKNTPLAYGVVAKSMHWLIALLVLGMLAVGLYMTGLAFSTLKIQLYTAHKTIGFFILWVVLLRLIWKFYTPPPPVLSTKKVEHILAHSTHFLLYACLLLMPLSGWFMSSADTIPDPLWFGLNLPQVISPDPDVKKIYMLVHEVTAWALIGLIGMHIAGALKHHIIDRDATLRRMLPFYKE